MIGLRPTNLGDINHIMSWVNDPEVVASIANIKKSISRTDELKWLKQALANSNMRLYSLYARTQYVGQAALPQIYWPGRNARFSIMITKAFQGEGLGQQAAALLFDEAFKRLKLHKLWCLALENNSKTVHLYRNKLKMVEEGKLIDDYLLNGRYHNMFRFYITEKMWL
jgi:RimJ/RimL family protein N-acetyltransferase